MTNLFTDRIRIPKVPETRQEILEEIEVHRLATVVGLGITTTLVFASGRCDETHPLLGSALLAGGLAFGFSAIGNAVKYGTNRTSARLADVLASDPLLARMFEIQAQRVLVGVKE